MWSLVQKRLARFYHENIVTIITFKTVRNCTECSNGITKTSHDNIKFSVATKGRSYRNCDGGNIVHSLYGRLMTDVDDTISNATEKGTDRITE